MRSHRATTIHNHNIKQPAIMFSKRQYEKINMSTNQSFWCAKMPSIKLILLSLILIVMILSLYLLSNSHDQETIKNSYDGRRLPQESEHDDEIILLNRVELFEADLKKLEGGYSLKKPPTVDIIDKFTSASYPTEDCTQTTSISLTNNGTLSTGANNHLPILPVLVIACNRISVKRSLDQLIAYRPSKEQHPIIVSQDCGHNETRQVIQSYGDELTYIQHNNLSDIELPAKHKKFLGYYKISRHYSWALNYTFNTLRYDAIIIIEDDLEISPDLFEYFKALYPILKSDETLYCISAWNDNGKSKFVNKNEPERLYRTDFFPGLGWMMTNKTYQEFGAKWPATFWDDWIRHPDRRKNRACVRPELPRTKTFGKIGVSNGQFYEDHLKYFTLNEKYVPFTTIDLSYLYKQEYDTKFLQEVYSSETITLTDLFAADQNVTSTPSSSLTSTKRLTSDMKFKNTTKRIDYSNVNEFKNIARRIGIMYDLKAGVARTAYLGIVSIYYKNLRIFLAPSTNWTGYDETAS